MIHLIHTLAPVTLIKMYGKGTCYADTSKAVADAQAIRDYALKRYKRAEDMLEQQLKQRQEESRRTEALLAERQRVVRELHTPGKHTVAATLKSIEGSVIDLAASTVDLERCVEQAAFIRDSIAATIAEHQSALQHHRNTKERCLRNLEETAAAINEATRHMENELRSMTREESLLQEQNKFFMAQIHMRAHAPVVPATTTIPAPVVMNGYACLADD